ncbi:unnamed protein product [Rotaria socialis]|uniref:Ty3 transposon capsid-like protein domain-containing protein n=1 Tax=Rotaria socialis TaxID=392032 RepID=A0A821DPB2_9BILA|nr:unnamed protein product [Rotaria socialis]CAF4623475.1 unnamed protein product [Rotaria socialis]
MNRSTSIHAFDLTSTLTSNALTSNMTNESDSQQSTKPMPGRKALIPAITLSPQVLPGTDTNQRSLKNSKEEHVKDSSSINKVDNKDTTKIDNVQVVQTMHENTNMPLDSRNVKVDNTREECYDDDNSFDVFILSTFTSFSGKQRVDEWLDVTESLFNQYKISRSLRYETIPLLLEGNAKRKYIHHHHSIQSFDDLCEFLLSGFDTSNTLEPKKTPVSVSQSAETSQLHSLKMSNVIVEPNATSSSGDASVLNHSSVTPNASTMSLDTITNGLRKAILQDLIKNLKLFRGGKDGVQKWIEDIDHLMEVAHVSDTNRLDLILYSLRGNALQWYKSYKSTFTSWNIFVQEIKKAFTSSFREELAFKTLESYVQAENQSVRNFYHKVLKLCKEADANMINSTKLENLLNKVKPGIQFEVRKKRPTTIAQFLDYAKEVEELLQLSGINVNTSAVSISKPIEVSDLQTPSANISSGYSRVFRPNQFRSYPRNQQYPFSSTQFTPSNTYNSYRRYANPTFQSNQRFQSNRFQPSYIPMNTSNNIPSHAPTRQNVNSRRTNSNFRRRTANSIQPLLASADIAQPDDMSFSTISNSCNQSGHEPLACPNF